MDAHLPFKYEKSAANDKIFLPAAVFCTPKAHPPLKNNNIPIESETGGIFFGPYIAVPAGCREVKFIFTVNPEARQSIPEQEIYLDIVSDRAGTIWFKRVFALVELPEQPATRIHVREPFAAGDFQFRAYSAAAFSSAVVFAGVRLTRLPDDPDRQLPPPETMEDRLRNMEDRLQNMNMLLAEKDLHLADVYNSRSWKITAPLRRISGKLRFYGFYKLLRRVVNIFN